MPFRFLTTSGTYSAGYIANLGTAYQGAFVAHDVVVASENGTGIVGDDTTIAYQIIIDKNAQVLTDDGMAIRVGGPGSSVEIRAGALVECFTYYAVNFDRTGTLLNYGTIIGGRGGAFLPAVSMSTDDGSVNHAGSSTFNNFGLVQLNGIAGFAIQASTGSGTMNLNNYGTINGGDESYGGGSYWGGYAVVSDGVTNTGKMVGAVVLGGGNDRIDTHLGTVQGTIDLGAGNDTAYGSAAADKILGGSENDLIRGGGGKDVLDGGTGVDIADYSDKTQKVQVTLNGSTAVTVSVNGVAEDSIKGFEAVYGGSAGDALTGDGLGNLLVGNAGNDTLTGNGGNDTLKGGAGADTLDGGANTDTADYSDKTTMVSVTLNGSTAATVSINNLAEDTIKNIENIIGGSASDALTGDGAGNSLIGNAGNDTLLGMGGNDLLKGGSGKDILDGGTGVDTADYSDKTQKVTVTLNGATAATVFINGTAAANAEDSIKNIENLTGGSADDKLTGDGLDNLLQGNAGNDTLIGGSGNDTLIGGAGGDSLTGGSGTDHFRFAYSADLASGPDILTDFTHGTDRIEIDDPTSTSVVQVSSFASVSSFNPATNTTQLTYDQSTGILYYDFAPGVAGGEYAFAVLAGHPAITASDLWWV